MNRSGKILQPSRLHRLLRITPGHAPRWLCSRDQCMGLDLSVIAIVLPLFGFAFLPKFYGVSWWWCVPVIAVCVLMLAAYVPFEDRERHGRARRRRGECVWCGQGGGTHSDECHKSS